MKAGRLPGARLVGVALALALAGVAAGCLGPGEYRCQTHDQCRAGLGEAFCESDGHCSRADTSCPSRRRYLPREGDRSSQCVGPPCATNALVSLAAGGEHACALRASGDVSCWGRNDQGQLGDGTRTPRSLDVPVVGLPPAKAIAAGARHTCALTKEGEVWCWGADDAGQLGDGGGDARAQAAPVPNVLDATAVVAGGAFSCALLGNGTATCWGDGTLGQLGDGAPAATRRLPTAVAGLSGLRGLSAHGQHACALRGDETLWCWGDNSQGQLGDGTTAPSNGLPGRVQPLTSVTAVATGLLHTCAATRADGLFCWGNNLQGQLGRQPGGPQPRPIGVPIVTNPVAVAAGDHHTCAIRQGGDTLCWGSNGDGQLGEGSTGALPFPVPVSGLGPSAAVFAGAAFSCATSALGDVFCWGDDHYGQLGLGRDAFRARAAPVPHVEAATELTAGAGHSCVVRLEEDGGGQKKAHAACWGANQAGQLGDGTIVDRSAVTAVRGEIEAESVSAGLAHTCAVAVGGAVWCWGRGSSGQLGPTRTVDTPTPTMVELVAGTPAAQAPMAGVTVGDAFTCAWQSGGRAFCWGANDQGQLGDGTMTSSPTPAREGTGLVSVDALAAGADHACARLTDGGLRCWGRGAEGQLGNDMTTPSDAPVDVALSEKAAPAPAAAVAAGAAHSCALDDRGRPWCWGLGADGRLGTEGGDGALTPTVVGSVAGASAVAAGGRHTCALTGDRTVVCWGANDDGQLGDGGTTASAAPVAVAGLTDVVRLRAGAAHTCALRADQTVWCWGANFAGQLGDGAPLIRPTRQLSRVTCK